MDDISIDLETLSTRPNAAILSIGAVQFDRDTGKIGKTFYVEVDMDDAIKHGHVSGSTLRWWMAQSDAAKSVFKDAPHDEPRGNLHAALCRLKAFILSCTDDARVWGNGPTADITWLDNAFASAGAGMDQPWKFWNIRCVRTTVDDSGIDRQNVPKADGPAHNALVDALWQAYAVIYARAAIKGKSPKITHPKGFALQTGKANPPKEEPVTNEAATTTRYWHHDESNTYFITKPGELLPQPDTCHEISKQEFDANDEL